MTALYVENQKKNRRKRFWSYLVDINIASLAYLISKMWKKKGKYVESAGH